MRRVAVLLSVIWLVGCGDGAGPSPSDGPKWPGKYEGTARFRAWTYYAPWGQTLGDWYVAGEAVCHASLTLASGGDNTVTASLALDGCTQTAPFDWIHSGNLFQIRSLPRLQGSVTLSSDPMVSLWRVIITAGSGDPASLADTVGCSPSGTWERWWLSIGPYSPNSDLQSIAGFLDSSPEGAGPYGVPLLCSGLEVRLNMELQF